MLDRMCQRLGGRAADGGFSMVEMMVALVVIALASGASAAFFITSIGGSNANKLRTTAAYIADQEMEAITSLPVADLVHGRSQTAVTALWATPEATTLKISSQDDLTNSGDYDSVSTHTAYIPTQTTRIVNSVSYSLFNFIDVCWMDVSAGTCGPSQSPADGDSTNKEYRASVDVHWVSNNGCSTGCDYSTSTLIDPTSDPAFNTDLDVPVISSFSPSTFYTFNTGSSSLATSQPCVVNGNTYAGDLVKVVTSSGLDANATVRVSTGGGSITSGSTAEVSATEIDFCLQTADVPGNYYITILNTDGGHANQPIIESGEVTSASWSPTSKTLTLAGSGFESGATLSDTSSESMSSATVSTNYPSSLDSAVIPNYTPPVNGAKDVITITNPDTTTVSYTLTAPKVTSTGLTADAGQPNNLSLTGSSFQSGMTASVTSGNCSNASVTYVSSGSVTLNFTGGTKNTTCVFSLYNPDGGTATNISVTNQVTAPVVSSVTSTNGQANGIVEVSTSTPLTLTGTGFLTGMTASVSGASCSSVTTPTITGSTSATLTLTSTATTGSCTVTLTNRDGGTGTFTVTVTKLSITGLSENTTTNHSTKVYTWTVTGTGFSTSTLPTVTMTEKVGTSTFTLTVGAVSVSSSTTLTFTATPHTTGTDGYTVTVKNPSGSTATNPGAPQSFTLS